MSPKTKMRGQLSKPVMSEDERALWPEKARRYLLSTTALFALMTIRFPQATFGQQSTSTKALADLPAGPMQAKATTACTECHEARIILQQRLSKAAWTKEVDKMIRWGALVDANDHDALIEYLSMNFGVDQPQYQPPRSSSHNSGTQSK